MLAVKLFVLFVMALSHVVESQRAVICYYGTWATYRQGQGKYDVEHINPHLCTHLIYSFVGLDYNGNIVSLDPYLDLPDNYGRNNFGKFNALKNRNPTLKTLVAVGGWNEGSAKFSRMAADPGLRRNFINSAIHMITTHGFDGLDVDWEYPNRRDTVHGVADINNFSILLRETKEAFSSRGLLLTAAVSATEAASVQSYDVRAISSSLDMVHLMTYDMNGAWDPYTGHNAPLFRGEGGAGEYGNTVEQSLRFWIGAGCPPEKIALGVPFYGRTFTLQNANQNGVGAPSIGDGISGQFTLQNGFLGYNEFCTKLQSEPWERRYDSSALVPYAVQGRNWVSYDDANSIIAKVNYAKQFNVNKVMLWSIETDDFHGVCGAGTYPLLNAINRALN